MTKTRLTNKEMLYFHIGLETLTLMAMMSKHMDGKKKHTAKGLMGILNVLETFEDSHIQDFKFALQMKVRLFGKDFIRECCEVAILLSEKCDKDVLDMLDLKDNTQIMKALEQKS